MALSLSRVPGKEDIYISGIFALRKPAALKQYNIRAILSVIHYSLLRWGGEGQQDFAHLSIDIDDVPDADIVVHFPRMIRFMEQGLYSDSGSPQASQSPLESYFTGEPAAKQGEVSSSGPFTPAAGVEATTASPAAAPIGATKPPTGGSPGAVLVHCAMGRSRSVSAVIAYLLWKYPERYATSATDETAQADRSKSAAAAVQRALQWIQRARSLADPNAGFIKQLEMWWTMGCPCDSDDAVEQHPQYQRWLYKRELEESRAMGRAPGWVVFKDEKKSPGKRGEAADTAVSALNEDGTSESSGSGKRVRCKKCRRVLATEEYIVPHPSGTPSTPQPGPQSACPHVFVEALSWMRPTLETEALDGRLVCPGARCGAIVGRFAWQGFKCSCGEWVCPAFSLNKAKVDEDTAIPSPEGLPASQNGLGTASGVRLDARAGQLGIRLPPRPGRGDDEEILPREKGNL